MGKHICQLQAENINAESLSCWPLCWGVPLPPGLLQPGEPLLLLAADGSHYAGQSRVLGAHVDDSIRRLLLHAELPLASQTDHVFQLQTGLATTAKPPARLLATGLHGAVGELTMQAPHLLLQRGDQVFHWELEGEGAIQDERAQPLSCRWSHRELVAPGPVAVGAIFHGELSQAGAPFAQLALTVHVYQQTPILQASLQVSNVGTRPIHLQALRLTLQAQGIDWQSLTAEIRHYSTSGPLAQPLPCDIRSDLLTISVNGDERHSRLICYNETWLALRGQSEITCLSVPDFLENYPYGIDLRHDSLSLGFWPAWHEPPKPLVQGCGKTHRFSLGFSPLEDEDWPQAFGYAASKSPLTRVAWHDQQAAGVFTCLPPYLPDDYPRLESTLYDIMYNRNRGFGKMNYGDDYSALYTNQGRGQGEIVWNNLEGDYPFHMFCQFQRTGHYLYWKEFVNGILHWSDVDFADHIGALIIHSAGHTSGHCSPCHNWAEGFREWYYATGHPRPLEILTKMAAWLKGQWRSGFFRTEPEPYVRGCGWGLIQLAAIQEVLADDELKAIIHQLATELLAYCRRHDGLVMHIPTGGNHVPRDNAFHSATVVIGAERCHRLYDDPVFRDLALAATEPFMDRRTCSPEGIAVYISGPEQDFPMQQAATFAMAALAAAWRLAPDERYIRRGMRMLHYCLDRGMIIDHMRIPGEFLQRGDDIIISPQLLMPNTQLSSYQLRGLLLFMKAAHEANLLKAVEYPF